MSPSTITTPEKEFKTFSTFRFFDYPVYQDSKKWFQEILALQSLFESQPDLWYQLKNNMLAVVMHITTASTKLPTEAKRSLGNAIVAANKVMACLDIACDLQTLAPQELHLLSEGFKSIIIQLKRLIKALGTTKEAPAAKPQE